MPRKTNAAGIALIKDFETFQPKAYLCPAGKWTIGYGHTGDVKQGMKVTQHQADIILELDLERFEEAVDNALRGCKTTDNQFSACVSLAFNIGATNFLNSTLLKKLRKGDMEGAANEFSRWVYAAGKKLKGLERRRAAEAELFRKVP